MIWLNLISHKTGYCSLILIDFGQLKVAVTRDLKKEKNVFHSKYFEDLLQQSKTHKDKFKNFKLILIKMIIWVLKWKCM